MEENLMQTQTGGAGETVQLQTQETPTAEQFDVQINPPVDSEPIQPNQPTEPVKPITTVPTQQEAQQQAILPTAPVEQPIIEQPVDDLDSIFNDEEILKPRALSIPNQPPNPETPKMGEMTKVDTSLVQPLNIVEEIEIEQPVEPEKPVDIPVPLVEDPNNPGILIQSSTPKQTSTEYKNKPVTVSQKGHVVKNTEIKESQNKPDGYYKYGDGIYQKKGNDWYKDVSGKGNFQKLASGDVPARQKELNTNAKNLNYNTGGDYYVYDKNLYEKRGNDWYKEIKGEFIKLKEGNVAQRKAELNKNAIPYRPGGKSYAVNMAENVITPKFGRIGDFNSYNLLTSGGDKVVASGMSFSSLTAPKIAGKDRMYNDDGTYNFNYDSNYAKSTPETRAIIDASKSQKLETPAETKISDNKIYNENVAYNFSDAPNQIINNEPIIDASIALSTKKPSIPNIKLVTGLDLNGAIKTIEKFQAPEYQQAFDNASNFAEKDLMTMFAESNKLSKEQFTQLSKYQEQVKNILGDGKYNADKAKALASVMANTENFFNQAKEINTFVNEAYSKDMSLGQYSLDQKKQDYLEQLNLKGNGDFQEAAKESFESTVKIADFIQENIDSGKMLYDRVNGGYKFSNNISETEKRYIETQLSKMTSDYEKLQQENYSGVRSEISEFKGELSGINTQISSLRKQAQGLSSDDPRLKEINSQLGALGKQKELIEKKIDNKESLLSTVFKTEPQKFAKDTARNMTETSQTILSAIPKEFSPKERFDFFYRQLSNANDGLAQANGIDQEYLSRLSRRFKDMFDWGGYFSLSDAEKEYLHNKAMLNQLAPMYYNNDFGITKSSGDFFESFMNSFDKTLLPNTAGAEGYFNQSEAANTMKSFLEEKGFTEEDMVDDDAIKALEDATRVDFLSRENWGNMIGTTAAIIAPLVATEMIPGSAVKVGKAVEKLIAGTNNVQKAAQYVNRASDAFDAAMSTTKLGRFLLPAVKEGVKFEATGRVFGSTEDEMYFMSGLIGGVASNAFTKVLAKMTPPQAAQYIQSMFGANANIAMKAIKKVGDASVRGAVETVEESAQELTNIYTDELRSRGFFDEVQSRFGTLDEVQKFLVSSFIMGAGFGLVSGSTADEAYESLSDDKKKQLNDVINAVKADYNYAEEKTENYVEAQERQNKRQENVEKDPEIKQEIDEDGDIQFDVEGIERTAEGKPSSVEVEESTFTEPVDLFNTEGNDQENQQRVSGEERVGEKPVEEQPVVEESQEEVSPSGVVQEEQVQDEKIETEKGKGKRPRTTKIAKSKEQEVVEETKVEEPAEPVATETVVETPAEPVAEVKEEGKYFIDGKEVSEEEAIKEIQDESRGYGFNLSGKKIEYQGSNEQAIRATKDHNKSISPVDNKGKLKSDYIDAAIRKAFNSVSFRKFGNAYRKHINPYFTRKNNESRNGGNVGGKNGMTWQELAGYIIGDDVNLATEEQFRAFAQELGLEVPTQETTQPVAETKTEPTTVEPVAKEETPKYETKEAPKKMVAPGRTKQAFDRNFTIEISADGKTATVQGEAIETADGRKLTPPKETAKITTNINGERVAITSKGDTVYLDRAKEAEEKQVETEGKTSQQIQDEYMEIARQSNGDYAIVYSRTNEPLVHKLNRVTGRWQALNSKGEWVDANDNRNAQANDAVNYTRKDRKEVDLNGDKFYFDFKNNAWKKYSESDGSLSSISKDEANKVQEEFVKENPKRAPKSKEEVKQVISDIIDGAKFDTKNLAMSSIIPPKLWNEILDLVKDALFKGVDLTFALNDAARKVFDKAVKSGQITDKQAVDFMDEVNSDKVTREAGLSSIKNDLASETAKKIASIGVENATIQEIIDSAEQAIKNGEIDPNFLIKQLIKDPRPTTPLETAVLIYSKTKMLNDLDDLYRQLNDTNPDADTKAIRDKIEILESDLLQHEVASSISGSQQGLSFSLRRIMMNSEYGLFLPRIQKIYKDAGKDMPEGLKEEIEKAQKELRRLNREIETKRKQADEAKDDEAVENIKNSSSKKGSGKKSLSKDGKVAVSIDSIRKAVSEGAKTIEEVIEAVRVEVTSTYPDATDRQIRDAISNYGREVNKTKDDLSEEVNRIRSVGRMISKLEDIQKQLATKVGKIKNDSVRTRTIKILTDRERELRRAIKEAMADIPVTEEELKAFQENKLEAYKKSLNDRNKELERRIKKGDFSTKTRTKAFELDEEARKLEVERQELIEQFEYEKTKAELAVEPDLQKVGRRLLDVFNLPKGLIASIDLSAPFRQGVIGVMSQNPIKTGRQIAQMWEFWKRPNTYDKWLSELKSSEFYPLLKASGLYVAEQNGKLSAMEEQFMNNLGNKIPILGQSYTVGGVKVPGSNLYKRSEVAYTGFLNNMRVQSFMEGADLLKEQGYTMAANPQVFKDWAKFCNSATGRGDMNPQLAVSLSPVFFSPRLIKARLEVLGLSPLYYSRMNPAARAMALKTMGRFMASTSLLIGMAALYYNNIDDDDKTSVDLDPRSTDFGKIKLGNTRLDLTGGMAVYYRTLAQFLSGQKKSTVTGRIEDLNQGFGKTTRWDVGEQFFTNKLAPFPSKFYQWAHLTEKQKANRIAEEAGEDNAFNRMGIPVAVQDLVIPLWMRDVEPIMKEQGYVYGAGLIGLSILGQGVQYYENKPKSSRGSSSIDFNFDDSGGIGDFNDAGGIGDFK